MVPTLANEVPFKMVSVSFSHIPIVHIYVCVGFWQHVLPLHSSVFLPYIRPELKILALA